jgi:hypothetical protein
MITIMLRWTLSRVCMLMTSDDYHYAEMDALQGVHADDL